MANNEYYSQVPKEALLDNRLSMSEKGVFVMIAAGNLVEVVNENRFLLGKNVNAELERLESLGYLKNQGEEQQESVENNSRVFVDYKWY